MAEQEITTSKGTDKKRLVAMGRLFDYMNRMHDDLEAVRLLMEAKDEDSEADELLFIGPIKALLDHMDSNKMSAETSPWEAFYVLAKRIGFALREINHNKGHPKKRWPVSRHKKPLYR